MATTVTRYVDPSSSGGNGTTNALSGANAAYASLTAWNTAQATNLVTADQIHKVILCSNGGGTPAESANSTTIQGWTTDLTRYIIIENEKPHGGVWNTGIHRFSGVANGHCLVVYGATTGTNNVKFVGLQIESNITSSSGEYYGMLVYYQTGTQANTSFIFERCIVKCNNNSTTSRKMGVYANTGGAGTACRFFFSNCIFQGWKGDSITWAVGDWSIATQTYVYNCTFYDNNYCFYGTDANWYVKNCGAAGCTYFASGSPNQTTNSTTTPTFVTPYTDLHLSNADTTWKGQGTDLSGDGTYPITVDIDNVTRSTPWSIGADQPGLPSRSVCSAIVG